VDRLGRSLKTLIEFLQKVQSLGIGLYLHQQALDTSTPAGAALFGMLGVFSQFERELLRERVLAGLQRARAQGRRLGRPPLPEAQLRAVRTSLAIRSGSLRQIASEHRIGLASVQHVRASMIREGTL
jgi:DNA invertase Pin-like site-specific DNA recombinase